MMEEALNSGLGSATVVGSSARYVSAKEDSGLSEENFDVSEANWKLSERRFWNMSSRTWTARRSTGSPLGEILPLNQNLANNIRRSMSFERMTTSCLNGEWPRTLNVHTNRPNLLQCNIVLTTDKWTQTTDDVDNPDSGCTGKYVYSKVSLSSLDSWNKKFETEKPSTGIQSDGVSSRASQMSFGDCAGLRKSKNWTNAVGHGNHKHIVAPYQNNADGFSQEVEKLSQYTGVFDSENHQAKTVRMQTPDGHRAPVAELLSMGCPNGRLLSACSVTSYTEKCFIRIPEDVPDGGPPSIPVVSGEGDHPSCDVAFNRVLHSGQTPGKNQHLVNVIFSPSPIVCKSLRKRQAPEGSDHEKRVIVDSCPAIYHSPTNSVRVKNSSRFNIPSEHSAFYPLLKKYASKKLILKLSVSTGTAGQIQ